MTKYEGDECGQQDAVSENGGERETWQDTNSAGCGVLDCWKFWAYFGAVDTDAAIIRILVVAFLGFHFLGLHAGLWVLFREIDLKGRTNKRFLVSEELQQLVVVFRSATDQIHGLAVCAAELDFLAAVIEACPVLFGYQLIELGDELLSILLRDTSDVDEKRLVRRASEGAECIEEVVLASRTRSDQGSRRTEFGLEGLNLQRSQLTT